MRLSIPPSLAAVLWSVALLATTECYAQNLTDQYPDCSAYNPSDIGNGSCSGNLNNAECGYDGGDCDDFNVKYPDCPAYYPSDIGNGRCDGDLNNAECGYDGGDCDEFNAKYPNCDVLFPSYIGNGVCDSDLNENFGENYNTLECQYEGGEYSHF